MSFARTSSIAPIQVLSDQLRLLLRSADSPFRMSAMVVDVPAGGSVPPHRHAQEEEGYFVLDGELTLTIGEDTRTLAAGDFGHVPPRAVHAYANRSAAPVRFLAWTVGGPMDEFFEAMSRHVKRMPQDAPAMAQLTARFGVQMVDTPA
ncbi:MAG: cupin domain-containing protein [Burkholderiaceae bacterium]|jgi:quercetin dioxygenase-like cupin family protein|nr:cupin domain-containing protein [Burkholderiaceae bacterium]